MFESQCSCNVCERSPLVEPSLNNEYLIGDYKGQCELCFFVAWALSGPLGPIAGDGFQLEGAI